MKGFAYSILTFILFFVGCSLQGAAFNTPLKDYLYALGEAGEIEIDGRRIIGNEKIEQLYQVNEYAPLWTDPQNRADLLTMLQSSYYEGLFPGDYDVVLIADYHTRIRTNPTDTTLIAKADLVMTDALLTYVFHMIQGKVSPTRIDPNWNYALRIFPEDVELRILDRLENKSLLEGNKRIKPEIPQYAKLKKWFKHYDSLENAGIGQDQIIYPGTVLRRGDSSATVRKLKRILSTYDRAPDAVMDDVFDEDFEEVVKDFQRVNGLDDDGIIGKNTFDVLNITTSQKLDIIRANMERCRWISNDLPDYFLLVNIADFHLYLMQDLEVTYSSRVVIGKEQHETPVFNSDIQYVVFNPTWTVPYSIATKEMLPRLQSDPNYLQNRNMTLLKRNEEVDPETVDFSEYSEAYFPYTVRQEPGPNNALGRMKFIFPNKHAVYLHDTPSKASFEKTQRAFSHGCVRVQDPEILAENLLGDKGYDQDKIEEVLDTKETTTVYLKEPLPVFLMYWTCYESSVDNRLYFFQDLYGRDQRILSDLYKSR